MDITVNQFSNTLDFNLSNKLEKKISFRIFYQNIRSLKSKIAEVEVLINNYKSDLIILTETWINEKDKKFYNFNNYNAFYSCRKRQGGGLGVFLHNSFECKIIENFESENHACIILKIDRLKLIIVASYRPPTYNLNDYLNFLDEKISDMLPLKYNCIIIGDMNVDLLNNNRNTERIMDIYNSNNFQLCNQNYPTRHLNNNHSLLDHIAINFKNKIHLSIISNSLSDHDIQLLDITQINKEKPKKGTIKKIISKINYKALDENLSKLEEKLEDTCNVNELYNDIINSYTSCIYKKTIKQKKKGQSLGSMSTCITSSTNETIIIKGKKYTQIMNILKIYMINTINW